MGHIVAIAGQKGGVGKSTIAISLAVELERRLSRVAILEFDAQRSASTWAAVRAELGGRPIEVLSHLEWSREELLARAETEAICFIDCSAGLSADQGWALGVCDLAIIPVGIDGTDVWSLRETEDLITKVSEQIGAKVNARVLINKKDSRRVAGKTARRRIEKACGIPVMRTELSFLGDFGDSITTGSTVVESSRKGVAAYQIRCLADELEELIGLHSEQEAANV